MQVYVNGNFVPDHQATVSVFDHGFLYGDGVFEGIRAYSGKIFCLQEHLERLWDSAKAICLAPPMSMEKMHDLCYEAIRINHLEDAYLRVIISRGAGDLGLNPRLCKTPSVIIIPGKITLYPQELYDNGMDVITAATPRNNSEALNPKIKSLNYLNNILAKLEGLRSGVMEVLMFNTHGYISEATGDNIFIVKKGVLITPPPEAGILLGITRQVVMDLASDMGIPCKESNINRYEIYTADECFLTGTAAEVIAVKCVDERCIGNGKPGPIYTRLREAFHAKTRE